MYDVYHYAPVEMETVIKTENIDIYYGDFKAVRGVCLDIYKNRVTAFIGPSGC